MKPPQQTPMHGASDPAYVFEEDKDRYGWVDLMERACGSYGWRVHAWVLMGNHFHLLVETPEPNLVAGMKWLPGVCSQGWNRGGRAYARYPEARAKDAKGAVTDGALKELRWGWCLGPRLPKFVPEGSTMRSMKSGCHTRRLAAAGLEPTGRFGPRLRLHKFQPIKKAARMSCLFFVS